MFRYISKAVFGHKESIVWYDIQMLQSSIVRYLVLDILEKPLFKQHRLVVIM